MTIINKRKTKYYQLVWLKHDLPAGLSVFLVALPLCLGIALACGAPLYAGLLSGIVGGLVVSLISGSPLSVSGPAAGLTAIIAIAIPALGDYRIFLLVVFFAGVIQLILGIARLGVIAEYFPSSVIKGMLAAIGILLLSKQIPVALGYDKPDFWMSAFPNFFHSGDYFIRMKQLDVNLKRGVMIITVVSLLIFILFKHPKLAKFKVVPIPLIVVVMGVLLNYLFGQTSSSLVLDSSRLVHIPNNIFSKLQSPDWSQLFKNTEIFRYSIIVAIVASLETLLCIEAVDKLDKHNRNTPPNRELVAQGIGNMMCGMIGAIPITAVIVRGSANIDAGARTKLSAFTHGVLLLLTVLLIPFALNKIPNASLAAILIITGYNLAKPKLFINQWKLGRKQFLPFIITIVAVLWTDMLIGIGVGILIALYFIIQNNFRADYKIKKSEENGKEQNYIKLNSNVTFLNKAKIKDALDKIPEDSILTIDGSECNFIDYDILEIISEFEQKAADLNIELRLKGIQKVDVMAIH